MSTFEPVEETWIDQRKDGGTKPHHDRWWAYTLLMAMVVAPYLLILIFMFYLTFAQHSLHNYIFRL